MGYLRNADFLKNKWSFLLMRTGLTHKIDREDSLFATNSMIILGAHEMYS